MLGVADIEPRDSGSMAVHRSHTDALTTHTRPDAMQRDALPAESVNSPSASRVVLPAPHIEQAIAAASEYCPASQFVQDVELDAEK